MMGKVFAMPKQPFVLVHWPEAAMYCGYAWLREIAVKRLQFNHKLVNRSLKAVKPVMVRQSA